MTPNGLYAIGTLLTWIGWFAAVRAAYLGLGLLFGPGGLDRARTVRGLLVAALVGAVALILGAAIPMSLGRPMDSALRFPLVWFVMPFWAWMGLVSATMTVVRGAQVGSR